MEKTGEAYGFFYYDGQTKDIANVLQDIRKRTETPTEMSLELIEGMGSIDTKKDSALVGIVEQAKRQHMSHALKAALPGGGNRKAANFLGNVMNGIYVCLYDSKGPFYTGIVYKRGDRYIFRCLEIPFANLLASARR